MVHLCTLLMQMEKESNIRKWIIENDLLETIVALPDKLFFNTGIPTFFWILIIKNQKRKK